MCPVCYQTGGSLLHCLSTLTSPCRPGGIISVALCLGVASTGRYPASCPVKPGLSSPAGHYTCSRDHLSYLPYIVVILHILLSSNPTAQRYTLKQLPPTNSLQNRIIRQTSHSAHPENSPETSEAFLPP